MSNKPQHTSAKKLEIVTISYQIGLRQTEKIYSVTKKTIQNWRKQYQDEGLAGLAKNNRLINRKRKISDCQKKAILELCASHPQIYNKDIIANLKLECSPQAVSKFRRQLTNHDTAQQMLKHWIFNYTKLPCSVDKKTVYLLTATEIQSGVIMFCLTEENIPLYLNAFVEYILFFLKSTGNDSDLKITANSSRFVAKKSFAKTDFSTALRIEYKNSKSKVHNLLPDEIKRKINTLAPEIIKHQDLLKILDEMFFVFNVESIQKNRHTDDWNCLKFQPSVITLNTAISGYTQKTITQVTSTLICMIEAEILKFNSPKAKDLLNYLIKIESLQHKSPELQIKIQILWGYAQLYTYDYSKALYHYNKALKSAQKFGGGTSMIDAEIAIAGFFLITSQYSKCEKALNSALGLSRSLQLKRLEGNILGKLGYLYKISNDQRASIVANLQLEIAIAEDDKELYCKSLYLISTIYFATGFYEKGFSYAQKSLNIAQKYDYPQAVFVANYIIAEYALLTGKYALGEEHLLSNIKSTINHKDYSPADVKNLTRLGLIKCRLKEFKTGLDILEKCLYLAKKRGDRFTESVVFNHIGQVFLLKPDLKKAAFYFNKAVKINEQIGNQEEQLVIYGYLSSCYSGMKQGKKALGYANKKLNEVKKTKNRIQIASAYGSIGSVAIVNSDYEAAMKYYQLQLKVLKPTDADLHKVLALVNIGTIHLHNQHYTLALSYFKKAEKKLIPLDDNQYLGLIYLDLAKIAKATGNVKKLNEYVKLVKEKTGILGDNFIVKQAEELLNT